MRRSMIFSVLGMFSLPVLALAQSAGSGPSPSAPPPPGHHGPRGPRGPHGMFGPEHQIEVLTAFYDANTTHDGHLTLAQAKAAGMKPVVDHFAAIDVAHRGYVTFNDIEAWRLDDMARHLEAKAAAMRAKD
ncbi:MAG: hypothetical protein POH28_08090 [Acidocella sp.]|nr:hypothetical protein [Acidocella sp.]